MKYLEAGTLHIANTPLTEERILEIIKKIKAEPSHFNCDSHWYVSLECHKALIKAEKKTRK